MGFPSACILATPKSAASYLIHEQLYGISCNQFLTFTVGLHLLGDLHKSFAKLLMLICFPNKCAMTVSVTVSRFYMYMYLKVISCVSKWYITF